ncbi:hypothetical protein QTP86_007791 [Hemibagrus guttatus]|nr:hypothetical protein QTP86_007791 [Hemibagrus guttatus]
MAVVVNPGLDQSGHMPRSRWQLPFFLHLYAEVGAADSALGRDLVSFTESNCHPRACKLGYRLPVKAGAEAQVVVDSQMTISPDLLPFITTVINGSITSGHVPTAFKKARVIPILKKPALDPSDISNYRYHGFCSDLSVSGLYISSWMMAHQLKLNPSKTELLVIPGYSI